MALHFAVVDLREQAADWLDEHRHRVISELLAEFDACVMTVAYRRLALKSPASQANWRHPPGCPTPQTGCGACKRGLISSA